MASKKYVSMPDVSHVEDLVCKTFANVDFREGDVFQSRVFNKCEFVNCNFENMLFTCCLFIKCKFINCILKNTSWRVCDIRDCIFIKSTFLSSFFDSNKIIDCTFEESSLNNAKFNNFYISDCDLSGTALMDAEFKIGRFINSDINPAYIGNPPFYKCLTKPYKGLRFVNVDFSVMLFANLDFSKLVLYKCTQNMIKDYVNCKNEPYIPMICPEEGKFIAYKKVFKEPEIFSSKAMIAVLEIPADAKRSSGSVRKCRCDKAKVLRFEDLEGHELPLKIGYSGYDRTFQYRVGEMAIPNGFNPDRWNVCSTGIHFFMNRQEAVNYNL